MSHLHKFSLAMLFVCAWHAAVAKPASEEIACPSVTANGNPGSVAEALTRVADKTEALVRVRVEHQAPGSEIYLLMRVELDSKTGLRNLDTLSRSPNDPKLIETSYNELAAHVAFATKVVEGFLHGDANLLLKRTDDSSAIGMLQDLSCGIKALSQNIHELGEHLGE